jgi:hypothetical protein
MQGDVVICASVNCGNPYGSNQTKSLQSKMVRKRKRHHDTPESSADFLHRRGEPVPLAKWTDYDIYLLQQVTNIVVGIDDYCIPDYDSVLHLFKEISSYQNTSWPSLKDIKLKVDMFLRDRAAFRIMLKQQLNLDYNDNS